MKGNEPMETKKPMKTFIVGIEKKEYQIFDDVEAVSEREAIKIAFERIKRGKWRPYGNHPRVWGCYEKFTFTKRRSR